MKNIYIIGGVILAASIGATLGLYNMASNHANARTKQDLDEFIDNFDHEDEQEKILKDLRQLRNQNEVNRQNYLAGARDIIGGLSLLVNLGVWGPVIFSKLKGN